MSATKIQTEATDTAPAAQVVAKQPEMPEKQGGPTQVARTATASSLPPPNGSPSAMRGAGMVAGQQGLGAGSRARMMRTLQRSVGNNRVSSLTTPSLQLAAQPSDKHGANGQSKSGKPKQAAAPRGPKGAVSSPGSSAAPTISRAFGARAIQRKCGACGGGSAGPNGCADCGGKQQVQRQTSYGSGTIQRKCDCGGGSGGPNGCAECEAKRQVQRSASSDSAPASIPASVTEVMQSGSGVPLQRSTRDQMENALGADLSGVRVHTGPNVARAAQDINAEAFTYGQDVYFAADRYQPDTTSGQKLLAHELTHTVQQRSGPVGPAASGLSISDPGDAQELEAEAVANRVVARQAAPQVSRSTSATGHIQRYSWDEFVNDVEDVGESVAEVAEDAGSAIASGAEAVAETVAEGAAAVAETVEAGAEAVAEGAEAVVEAGAEALDWLATEAGQVASAIADALGVSVRITASGLVIDVPGFCPIDAMLFPIDLDPIEMQQMVPVMEIPIAPDVFIQGEVGLAGTLQPGLEIQAGPICLNGLHILINPLTNTYSISGSISATTAAALSVELRAGLRGQLGLMALVPIGPVVVPITAPLVGVEGGLAGMIRGIGAQTLTIGRGFSMSSGAISLSESTQLDLGLALDIFAGAYGSLDIGGKHVCTLYWQPYEWHGDTAISLGTAINLTMLTGGTPTIILSFSPPSLSSIPFSQIPLAISREGFEDDCPIIDQLCEIVEFLGLLPSQNGGVWNWSGPYGPGSRLAGPLDVYQRDPGIASGSHCRGACGIDCETCAHEGVHYRTDPITGEVWEYTNFEDCNSHENCRQHDAAFDWAADVKGEIGSWAMFMPWHMAANLECLCNYLGGNCIAWAFGLPPHDSQIFFADAAVMVPGPGPVTPVGGECKEDNPDAIDCTPDNSDRDTVLQRWGDANAIGNFRDCEIFQGPTSPGLDACDGAPGTIWHCTATDLPTGQDFTLSINECICCNLDGTVGSEWRQPEVVVTSNMSEELILSLCERNLIVRVICIPIEEEMIGRFGNRRRKIGLDPDKDPSSPDRLDDAKIFEEFRKVYNRLDSWKFFINARHPDLFPEFTTKFDLVNKRNAWLETLKAETRKYKDRFRNLENQDIKPIQSDFEKEVMGKVRPEMEALNREIAQWFKDKTGSTETIDQIIERVHTEGTEIWREAWRAAILQVNRVLARLWPPAKTEILDWIGKKRAQHPDKDLSGNVGELDYIGSLATGFKGPPKQQIRFNPDKFDVDANLEAPPLAKYAVLIDGLTPDRGRIFGRTTTIDPLNVFSNDAHAELKAKAKGYDSSEPFDVAISTPELPTQERQRVATERIFGLRDKLPAAKYQEMIEELKRENMMAPDPKTGGTTVRGNLTDAESQRLTAILDRYEVV